MKRLSKSLSYAPRPVKLYLDEIEQIVEELRRGSEKVEIRTDEYQIDSLEQLRDLRTDRVPQLHLATYQPHISLELGRRGAYLYSAVDDPVGRGIFEAIKTILQKHQRNLASMWAPIIAGALIGIVPSLARQLRDPFAAIVLWAVIGIGAVWTALSFRYNLLEHATIFVRYRSERPPFLKRNADQIWLALVSAAIGSAVTLVFQKVFK